MEESKITINIAKEFSKYPGGYYIDDGPFSGEQFRINHLAPALRKYQYVLLEVDGTLGYGSSFLASAFGDLITVEGFSMRKLRRSLIICTSRIALRSEIWNYIEESNQYKLKSREEELRRKIKDLKDRAQILEEHFDARRISILRQLGIL